VRPRLVTSRDWRKPVPIKQDTADAARRLVEEGPPFDVARNGLERHHVFVSESEVAFLFEGEGAAGVVDSLAAQPGRAQGGGALAGHSRRPAPHFEQVGV